MDTEEKYVICNLGIHDHEILALIKFDNKKISVLQGIKYYVFDKTQILYLALGKNVCFSESKDYLNFSNPFYVSCQIRKSDNYWRYTDQYSEDDFYPMGSVLTECEFYPKNYSLNVIDWFLKRYSNFTLINLMKESNILGIYE